MHPIRLFYFPGHSYPVSVSTTITIPSNYSHLQEEYLKMSASDTTISDYDDHRQMYPGS